MHHARAHYVHIVCTSGHLLWRCSKQPIIYSTLISTHVNLHQSSHSACHCYGIHIISWQDKWAQGKKRQTCFDLNLPSQHGRSPLVLIYQLSLSNPINKLKKKKVIRQIADWPGFYDSLQNVEAHLKRHHQFIAYSMLPVTRKSQAQLLSIEVDSMLTWGSNVHPYLRKSVIFLANSVLLVNIFLL